MRRPNRVRSRRATARTPPRTASAIAIAEGLIGGMATRAVPAAELVYMLARSAGLRDEQINIQGFPEPPRETFEIVVPIDGVTVDEPGDFAGVRFLPSTRGSRAL